MSDTTPKGSGDEERTTLQEASTAYRDFLTTSLKEHERRAVEARTKVEAGEYDLNQWGADLFAFGAQLWSDAIEATGHLVELSNARADTSKS